MIESRNSEKKCHHTVCNGAHFSSIFNLKRTERNQLTLGIIPCFGPISISNRLCLDLPPSDLIISMSTNNRLVEVMEAALAISSNPAFENDDGQSSTMRPKPILSKTPPIHRPQQKRVQFSGVVTGSVVPSRDDMSEEEKRCIWYRVSSACLEISRLSFL